VRNWLQLVFTVESRGDPVVEGEGIPGKAPVLALRAGDALEGATTIGLGRQVLQRAERAVDEPRWLVEYQVLDIAFAQIELYASLGRPGTSLPRPDPKLHQRAVRLAC
jgi:hypothetical protein